MFCAPIINEINKLFLNQVVLRRQIINGGDHGYDDDDDGYHDYEIIMEIMEIMESTNRLLINDGFFRILLGQENNE